jgi:4'-phosphopantetheinyl transferase
MGLKLPLAQFSFHVEEKPIRISFGPKLEDDPARWQFSQRKLSERHMLAMGVDRGSEPDLEVRIRSFVPGLPLEESAPA